MKKYRILIIILVLFAVLSYFTGITDMKKVTGGKAVFIYEEKNVDTPLSEEHLEVIKEIFDKKILYRDNPSCGFDENIAVKLCFSDNRIYTFCFARDTCNGIYWKEKNKYFDVSESEQKQLHAILETYGFRFPCV